MKSCSESGLPTAARFEYAREGVAPLAMLLHHPLMAHRRVCTASEGQ